MLPDDKKWKYFSIAAIAIILCFEGVFIYGLSKGYFPVPAGDGIVPEPPRSVTVKLFIECENNSKIYATFYSNDKVDVELYRDDKLISIILLNTDGPTSTSEDGNTKFWGDANEKYHFTQEDNKLVCEKATVIE